MKTILQFASCLLLSFLPASAAITRNGSASWPRTTAPGTFDAASSTKLVVVVSGEHNFANNYTGTCSAVTYNGQPLMLAVRQAPVSGGHGQTYSSIWYLDNPGSGSGSGNIVVTCTGTSWVATAIGLSGTLPGVGPIVAKSGAASAGLATTGYGSLIIAACGMGGQGNTASPLPGVAATIPATATTIAGLSIGSSWAGHAVASAEVAMPSNQTIAFNTAKTDVVTVAAAFPAANPAMPAGPTPTFHDIVPGTSVGLDWNNFLPTTGTTVWVDVWIGPDQDHLTQVVTTGPNQTSMIFTAPEPGTYCGRIDSYLQGSAAGTPTPGTLFPIDVSATGLRMDTWLGLRPLPSLLLLQREGIAVNQPDSTQRLTSASLTMPVPSGVRLRGLFKPETSGPYTFHISGSENTALWLSPDASRFHKQRIAWQLEPTANAVWNQFPTQTSAPMQLQEGVSYYLEAQVMNSIGNGHLELGVTLPGSTVPEPIPASLLSYLPADPDDANDNGLPNSWEQATRLDTLSQPGDRSEYGDPDNDGISNFDEYQLSLDENPPTPSPLVKDALADGLTRDTWTKVTSGWFMSDFTSNRPIFLNYPNEILQVAGIDDNARGEYYGARYRGFVTAPATGYYRFWIAGNKKAELWLADGTAQRPGTAALTNRFGKQLIALNADPKSMDANARYDFDQFPMQRSRAVYLVKDQSYYIEALHKQRENPAVNHIAVAWQPPGQPRALIPAGSFISDVPDDNDKDSDFLPDSWEILTPSGKPAHNLNPADNGLTDPNDGQYGDPDGDGLTNLEEYQLGTHPRLADTDGDGLSDKAERDYYHTDPLVSNAIQSGPLLTIPLAAFTATSVPWNLRADGSALAYERRGWTDFPITVADGQQGVYEIALTGGAEGGSVRSTENLPLTFQLDGTLIGRQTMTCLTGQNTTLKQLTPWLPAGTHTLRVENHNVRAGCNLRINSLTVQRLGGAVVDATGVPLWAQQKLAAENHLTRLPAASRTSPACIEGVSSWPASILVSRSVGVPPTSPITPETGPDHIFYANIPLDPATPTGLAITMQNGGLVQPPHTITWTPTNLIAEHNTTLTLRKDDSLLLTAYTPGAAPSGTFTLSRSLDPATAPPLPGTFTGHLPITAETAATAWPDRDPALLTAAAGTMQGAWVPAATPATAYHLTADPTTATFQLQFFGGLYTKVVKIRIDRTATGLAAWQVYAKYLSGNHLGEDFDTNSASAAPSGADGYGVTALSLTFLYAQPGPTPLTDANGTPYPPLHAFTSSLPHVLTFATPGTHTLTAVWTPEGGVPSAPTTLTVIVKAADFGPDFIVQTYNRRTWTHPGVNGMDIEAGSDLTWAETTSPGAADRSFTVDAYETGLHPVLARLPETGDIIAKGNIYAFMVAEADETADAQYVEYLPGGGVRFRFTMVADGLPPNAEIRLRSHFQGAVFGNGSRDLVLHASDFDENGIANIYMDWAADAGEPRTCHSTAVFLVALPNPQ